MNTAEANNAAALRASDVRTTVEDASPSFNPAVISNEHLQTEVQSPFLPGTNIQFAWDSTSLGYLKTCPRLYQYIMIEGWSPYNESIHLRFGSEFHKALEDYDRYRAEDWSHDEALHFTVRETLIRTVDFQPKEEDFGKHARLKSRHSLLRAIIWYLDKYSKEDDNAETFILDNGKPAVELSFRFELDWGPEGGYIDKNNERNSLVQQPYILCGHLDRVVKYNSDLFVMDRKTTTTTPGDYYFEQFNPNNQMSLYTLGGKVVLNSPIRGVIIDAVQLLEDSVQFKRGFTMRTGSNTNEWVEDLIYWFNVAESFALAKYWPMNDTSCDKFGGCVFREVCRKDPKVRVNYLKSNFVQKAQSERWNPLSPRGT